MVGWARQHYRGVTYHTCRFLSIWVGRIPYEMTDAVIENIGEVLGIQSKSDTVTCIAFQFRGRWAPDSVIGTRCPTSRPSCPSFLYNLAHQRPWYEFQFGAILGIENQIPTAHQRAVAASRSTTPTCCRLTTTPSTIHITVDEEHGGGWGSPP
jgi:hypothetical protein